MPHLEGRFYPHEYECPITMQLMNDPVIAADGFSYECNAITAWLNGNQVSPKTGAMLANTNLIPNQNLRILILDFRNRVAQEHRQAEQERVTAEQRSAVEAARIIEARRQAEEARLAEAERVKSVLVQEIMRGEPLDVNSPAAAILAPRAVAKLRAVMRRF